APHGQSTTALAHQTGPRWQVGHCYAVCPVLWQVALHDQSRHGPVREGQSTRQPPEGFAGNDDVAGASYSPQKLARTVNDMARGGDKVWLYAWLAAKAFSL